MTREMTRTKRRDLILTLFTSSAARERDPAEDDETEPVAFAG